MHKIALIVGLPGSGKTHFADMFSHLVDEVIDDPKNFITDVEPFLKEGVDIILSDPNLCNAETRQAAINKILEYDYNIELVFFANDEKKCRANIKRRNDGRKIGSFKAYNYTIPENTQTMNVWEEPKEDYESNPPRRSNKKRKSS